MIQGKDIIILVGGTAVAACKSNDLNIDTDIIEVSSPSSANAREYISGRSSWSASSSHLISFMPNIVQLKGQTVDIVVKSPGKLYSTLQVENGDYAGRAIVKSVSISAAHGSISTGSIQLQGTGELTRQSNYTLVNNTTYTIFNPDNRAATEQTFSSNVHVSLSDYNNGSNAKIAIICNGVFKNAGVAQQAVVSSFKFYNRDGTYYDCDLGAYVTRTNISKTDYPLYISWKINNLLGTYDVAPKVYFE